MLLLLLLFLLLLLLLLLPYLPCVPFAEVRLVNHRSRFRATVILCVFFFFFYNIVTRDTVTPANIRLSPTFTPAAAHPYLFLDFNPTFDPSRCPSYAGDGDRRACPSSERTRTRGVFSLFPSLKLVARDLADLIVLRRLSFVVSPVRPRTALTMQDRPRSTGEDPTIILRSRVKHAAI